MITSCPICGGRLQATQVYHAYMDVDRLSIVRSDKGGAWFEIDDIDDESQRDGPMFIEESFYCENDHNESQMIAVATSMKERN